MRAVGARHPFFMSNLDPDRLLAIIKLQTEIAKLGLDLGGVMSLVAEHSQRLTGADGAVVEIAEGTEMVYRAVSGIAEPMLGLRLSRGTSLSGLCVGGGAPLRCDDTESDPRVDLVACRTVGIGSMIVAPLKHEDSAVGVLKVLSRRSAAFNDIDMDMLALMSDLIAAAMYHANKYSSDEMFHRATHDAMTGLANRALFYDRLRSAMAQAKRREEGLAVVIFDMDNLKPINDTLGHRAGDFVLVEFAMRLRSTARDCDTVARLGGDEYAAILPKVGTQAQASAFIHRFLTELAKPADFDGRMVTLCASFGAAIYSHDGDTPERLMQCADTRMYSMKRGGKKVKEREPLVQSL